MSHGLPVPSHPRIRVDSCARAGDDPEASAGGPDEDSLSFGSEEDGGCAAIADEPSEGAESPESERTAPSRRDDDGLRRDSAATAEADADDGSACCARPVPSRSPSCTATADSHAPKPTPRSLAGTGRCRTRMPMPLRCARMGVSMEPHALAPSVGMAHTARQQQDPFPDADVAGTSPVPVQMCPG